MSAEILPVTDSLEAHEFAIPCGTQWHETWGTGDADWVVWQLGFACDACLQAILTYHGAAVCGDCAHRHEPARNSITRVEPLRHANTRGNHA